MYFEYLPHFLYAIPFIVAAVVLIREQLKSFKDLEAEGDEPVLTPQDPVMAEVRSRPDEERYISFGI
jgi:hypothetical protein